MLRCNCVCSPCRGCWRSLVLSQHAAPWPAAGKTVDKTATGLTYIPAPKLKLPGHEESYNPPAEYLPTEASGAGMPGVGPPV